jgi:hypothetical protein
VSSIVGVPVVLATAAMLESAAAKALFLATTLAVFAVLGWTQLVHAVERDELQSWLRLRRRAASPPG